MKIQLSLQFSQGSQSHTHIFVLKQLGYDWHHNSHLQLAKRFLFAILLQYPLIAILFIA